jgi:predicted membrane protein
MDSQLLSYSLAGLFAGSVPTALVATALFKFATQATLATGTFDQIQPISSQSSSPVNAPPMSRLEQQFIVMIISTVILWSSIKC